MNIIYVVEDFSENGGVERIVSQKANTLACKYKHKVSIVSIYHDNRPMLYTIDKSVEMIKLEVPFAKKGKGRIATLISRVATLASAAGRLNKAVKSLNPDIIFFATTLGALLLPLCKTKAKRVYESHSARPFTPYQGMFGLMERRADTVVCLTNGDAAHFDKAKKVVVIPNFIERPQMFVEDYSIKRCIAVGRLRHEKGFDILIDCWQTVVKKHPDWHLDIYGEGQMQDELQAQIDRLNLNKHITLCGRSNNIMEMYTHYSMQIMTSRYEGQPMTLIEAQACGLPAVVTDFKFGASDIVKDGINGMIVKQGDQQALADAISKMMSSEETRRQYGANARCVGEEFYKENVFNKWTDFISKLHS